MGTPLFLTQKGARDGLLDRSYIRDCRSNPVLAMTAIYRFCAFLLLALTLAMCCMPVKAFPANADTSVCSVGPCYVWTAQSMDGASGDFTAGDYAGAAAKAAAAYRASSPAVNFTYTCALQLVDNAFCPTTYTYPNGTSETTGGIRVLRSSAAPKPPVYSCPSGAVLSGSNCTCTPPAVENASHNGCVAPVVEDRCKGVALIDSAAFGERLAVVPGVVRDGEMCLPDAGSPAGKGCTVAFVRNVSYHNAKNEYETNGSYRYSQSSATCSVLASTTPGSSTSSITPTPAKPTTCKGQPGQVNGVDVCIPFSSSPGSTVTSKTGTESVKPPSGPPVETITSEETTCESGVCTTKKIITTVTGTGTSATTATGTSTTVQTKGDFCDKNKQAVECGGSGKGSGFGGSCGAGFTCDGDAVQCALAKEVHRNNCKLLTPDADPSLAYNKAINKIDGYDVEKMKADAQQINVGSFDTSGAGWSRSCPSDPYFQLPFAEGRAFAIPFSRICGPLGLLSGAGVGITLLGCLVWCVGGKKA